MTWSLVFRERFARYFMNSQAQINFFWNHAICFTWSRRFSTLELTRASLPSLIGCAIPFLQETSMK
jgi:hypothetical protein